MQARTATVAAVAILLSAVAVQADVFNMGSGLTSLTMVTVGNPGNASDVNLDSNNNNPLGSVAYTYQMGEFDVTAAQYCQFLNAVAKTDPYGLYSTSMANTPSYGYTGCGIVQTGNPGNYSYNISNAGFTVNNGNFPVNYVSWGDAARFCNWLTNGQPTTGVENLNTTENGSYYLNGVTSTAALMAVTRTVSAKYVIPTENEWYKAAYYKGGGTNAGYWEYPTQSNTVPSNVLSSTGTNNANFWNGSSATDPTNILTVVGAFADSPGPYGTYDMGGDVWQWNEANIFGYGLFRGIRGGSAADIDGFLQAARWNDDYPYDDPTGEFMLLGFRVSEVPEPATMAFLALGGLVLFRRKRN